MKSREIVDGLFKPFKSWLKAAGYDPNRWSTDQWMTLGLHTLFEVYVSQVTAVKAQQEAERTQQEVSTTEDEAVEEATQEETEQAS